MTVMLSSFEDFNVMRQSLWTLRLLRIVVIGADEEDRERERDRQTEHTGKKRILYFVRPERLTVTFTPLRLLHWQWLVD